VVKRCQPGAENPSLVQDLERTLIPGDVQLIPGSAVERATAVGTNLGRHRERAEQAERASCNRRVRYVEVHRHLAATLEMDTSGGMEQAGQFRESVA
jgi:hypothetical protein